MYVSLHTVLEKVLLPKNILKLPDLEKTFTDNNFI